MTELEENQDVPLIENIHGLDGMIKIDELSNKEFLLLAETLTRIGMICKRVDDDKPTLYQTAYVLHKKGNYYLAHYKQLYELDFKNPINGMTETDYKRLCRIARCDFRLQPVGQTLVRELQSLDCPGRTCGAGRAVRCRQDHHRQPGSAPFRRRGRPHPDRRPRRA